MTSLNYPLRLATSKQRLASAIAIVIRLIFRLIVQIEYPEAISDDCLKTHTKVNKMPMDIPYLTSGFLIGLLLLSQIPAQAQESAKLIATSDEDVSLYSEKNTSSPVVAIMEAGALFKVREQVGSFFEVIDEANGYQGYIPKTQAKPLGPDEYSFYLSRPGVKSFDFNWDDQKVLVSPVNGSQSINVSWGERLIVFATADKYYAVASKNKGFIGYVEREAIDTSIRLESADVLKREVVSCSKVDSDENRLNCYDNLTVSFSNTENDKLDAYRAAAFTDPYVFNTGGEDLGVLREDSETPRQDAGQWLVRDDVGPLDDSRTVTLRLISDTGRSVYGDPVSLVLRCRSGELDAYINWKSYIAEDYPRVTYRVGNSEAETKTWINSSDNRATFFRGNEQIFIEELVRSRKFVAQVTPYNESPITATFDLHGLNAAIRPLRASCRF